MRKVAIVGDTHGNVETFEKDLRDIGTLGIQQVFVVGDFGLWTHTDRGHRFLDRVNTAAEDAGLTVFAVGGNHENWDHWNWFVDNMPKYKGMAMVRQRVLLIPKVHKFVMHGQTFAVAGGAVSIDQEYRRAVERGDEFYGALRLNKPEDVGMGSGPRTMYWPNEELTDHDVAVIERNDYRAKILLTHDCSNFTLFKNRLKPDPASERHRRRIDKVIAAVEPRIHFHGHMHEQYVWENTLSHGDSAFIEQWDGPSTKTYGLDRDGEWNNWGVLDVDTLDFSFRGKD